MGDDIRDIACDDFPSPGLCPARAPAWLNAIAVSNGFLPRPLENGFAWADFSCGDGIDAAVLAAANPDGLFFAAGPAVRGRALSQTAALSNLHWLSGAVANIPDDALPPWTSRSSTAVSPI